MVAVNLEAHVALLVVGADIPAVCHCVVHRLLGHSEPDHRVGWDQRLELVPEPPKVGAVHTCFAEIRGRVHAAAMSEIFSDGVFVDAKNVQVFNEVASRGALFGVMMEGGLLDLGVMNGYRDGCQQFDEGNARWRRALNDSET